MPADSERTDVDGDYIADIACDVLRVLKASCFFEQLDNRFSPVDRSKEPIRCGHSLKNSIEILSGIGMDAEATADVLAVLRANGGFCDCEVLYNVAEESRLRSVYWQARAAENCKGDLDTPSRISRPLPPES